MKSHTKDEKYLVSLYETALVTGDPYSECEMYMIGNLHSLNERAVNNIVKLLAQTNFIQKQEGTMITLTPHGKKLVDALLEQ